MTMHLACRSKLLATVLLLGLTICSRVSSTPVSGNATSKLLYILLDGFRYNYLDNMIPEEVPGFTSFIVNGVRAEYVNPLHPSVSFPSWTTLVTGLYAESHGIVGNYFYDPQDRDYFSLFDDEATGKQKWWTAEPVWTTATNAGRRVALHLWSRCDVPFDGVLPEYCDKFTTVKGPEIFRMNIEKALTNFEQGFDLVHVYVEHVDDTGHGSGPESEKLKQAIRDLDVTMVYLLDQLVLRGLQDQVNVVIVSDHGMTSVRPGDVTRVKFDTFLPSSDCIENIADYGAFSNIKVKDGCEDEVFTSLSNMPNVTVYRHADIPDDWNYKNSPYVHEIYVQTHLGNVVMTSHRPEMLPQPGPIPSLVNGAHGYLAEEMDMKSIFWANGPAFKSNFVLSPINIVDIYQVLPHVLNFEGRPNNGTFQRVADAFV